MSTPIKPSITLPSVENDIQVRFSDTDAMGHISSGSYAAFAEVGRAAFFKALPEPREEIPWISFLRAATARNSPSPRAW